MGRDTTTSPSTGRPKPRPQSSITPLDQNLPPSLVWESLDQSPTGCLHLARKQLWHLHLWQCQIQCQLNEFLAFSRPRQLRFIHTPIDNRSLCYVHSWEFCQGQLVPYDNIRKRNRELLNNLLQPDPISGNKRATNNDLTSKQSQIN